MKKSKISMGLFAALLASMLFLFGCDIEYMGDECECEDDFWGDGCDDDQKNGDSPKDSDDDKNDPDDDDNNTSDDSQETDEDTGTIEETQTYREEHECDQVDPEDPCQDAICEGIEGYEKALGECEESSSECECAFIDSCLVTLIECVNQNCEDGQNHDVGNMIDCVLDFSRCIDPCE